MYMKSQDFRMKESIHNIRTLAYPHFWIITECYPLYLHGNTKISNPISWEMAGQIKAKELFAHDR